MKTLKNFKQTHMTDFMNDLNENWVFNEWFRLSVEGDWFHFEIKTEKKTVHYKMKI